MKEDLDLTIIIVNWNTRDMVLECLRSIFEQTEGLSYEVILVDNASSDGSAEAIKREFPQVQLVESQENLGFARANNLGMRMAKGRYVLLLNPDTEIMDAAIEKSIAFADKQKETGVIGCRVFLPSGLQQSTLFRYLSLRSLIINLFIPAKWIRKSKIFGFSRYVGIDLNEIQEVEVVAGCFMLVRSEVIEHVGGMDPDFFMYGEEAEWCFRIRQKGWRICYYPGAKILHHHGQSTKQCSTLMVKEMARNQLLFVQKTRGRKWAYLANLLMLARDLPRVILFLFMNVIPFFREKAIYNSLFPAANRASLHLKGIFQTDWQK